MTEITHTIKPRRRTAAQIRMEVRMLGLKLTELEKRLKREQGSAVFAEYREAVKAAVEREIKPDTGNVIRLHRQ